MANIHILDDALISKIAAGEVIERPSSVVKELIENAVDACASVIEIELKEGGKKSITVRDNGKGMDKEDAELSIVRHATSKITSQDDLFSIGTLGFRGEALASISSVSNFTLITRKDEAVEGTKITVTSNQPQSHQVGCKSGTQITVDDLFINVPVRQKYLKSETHELKSIVDIVSRYALLYTNIAFVLKNEDKTIFSTTRQSSPLQNIIDVYGSAIAKELIEVDYSNVLNVKGYISRPQLTRANKDYQTLFINGRYVKNKIVTDAIYDSYQSMLFTGRHPVVILKIELDPSKIDVNVHPTKKEIRLEEESLVYKEVYQALRTALTKERYVDDFQAEDFQNNISVSSHASFNSSTVSDAKRTQIQSVNPSARSVSHYPSLSRNNKSRVNDATVYKQTYLQESISAPDLNESSQEHPKKPYRILGQVHKCFILVETDEGFAVIDQHTANERILYDKLKAQLADGALKYQSLIEPQHLELNLIDSKSIVEHLTLFKELGFEIDEFGQDSFIVRSIPVVFHKQQTKDLIIDILDELNKRGKSNAIEDVKEDVLARMSCRSSVMRGDVLTLPQMEKLLDELYSTSSPNTCPHGRPIIISMSMHELEKKFKRI